MEKNQAITLAIGAGALGTALAFFGYNYMNLQTNEASEKDKSLYNEVDNDNEVDNSNKEDEGQELKEIKKEVEKEVVDKKTAWAQFWGQEYNKKEEKEEEVEESE